MGIYNPPAASTSAGGFNIYQVSTGQTIDIPVGYENICTTIFTADGVFQVTGKATVL